MLSRESNEKGCTALESILVEYLDGRARPAERRSVEQHLEGCSSCRARVQEFGALWSEIEDLPEISPSPAFDVALRALIAAEPVRRSFWDWLPSPRLAFAVTALIAMSVWMSSMPHVIPHPSMVSRAMEASKQTAESDFGMIRDLPELENFDVISKFDALSELPGPVNTSTPEATKEIR